MNIKNFSHGLIGALLVSGVCQAQAVDDDAILQTEHGTLKVFGGFNEPSKVTLDGKPVNLDDESYNVALRARYRLASGDEAVLLTEAEGQCALFRFITLSNARAPKVTPAFGTCDDGPKITRSGDSIQLRMQDSKGKVKGFTYRSGTVTNQSGTEKTSGARPANQATSEKELERAVGASLSTYRSSGMGGLIAKTQDCYRKSTGSSFYCFYLDAASRHIDDMIATANQFPRNQFFGDEQYLLRVGPVLMKANMDMNTANHYLSNITPVINKIVDRKIQEKL